MNKIKAKASSLIPSVLKSNHPVKGQWQIINSKALPRSSHTISVVAGRAYIFGGEVTPPEQVDNRMHIITLPYGSVASADYYSIPAKPKVSGGPVPEWRIGHTAAVIGERIFIFGGKGGNAMEPLHENGRVWIYDTRVGAWTYLDPKPGTPFPKSRSYHSSISFEQPEPPKKAMKVENAIELPKTGTIAEPAQMDEVMGGYGTFFVHAGCVTGGLMNDLWAFDVRSRTWKEFPPAPGQPRSRTSIVASKNRIYRYGGFDGQAETGGELDILEWGLDAFHGDMRVSAPSIWRTLNFKKNNSIFPGNRSVAGLHAINTVMGREYLVLLLGERDANNSGVSGAGKFWSDAWAFKCPPLSVTAASVKDAAWQALGKETGEGVWEPMAVADAEVEGEGGSRGPGERGWFAYCTLGDLDARSMILWGGINARNERKGDGWILKIV